MGAESTLLPLFRAVDALAAGSVPGEAANKSAIDWTTVDFVTDRNNLRKLVRWVRDSCATPSPTPTPSGAEIPASGPTETDNKTTTSSESCDWDQRKDFRIDIQLGGRSTVLMHRWAAQDLEWAEPPKAGCRSNFVRESTAAVRGCEDCGGHYRIVQYVSAISTYFVKSIWCLLSQREEHRRPEPRRPLRSRRLRRPQLRESPDRIARLAEGFVAVGRT